LPASGGDLSGSYGATTVAKIQGVAVSATVPTNGQILSYDGSSWIPAALAPTSFTGALSGDVTGTQSATAISAATVTSKPLTGYVSGAGTVAASDSILAAIQKLNGNAALMAPIASPTFTGTVVAPLIEGGTATTSPLTYRTTSGVGTTGADHIFQVGNNGATEAMRILNSGNVGIGTTAPGASLDIYSAPSAAGSGTPYTGLSSYVLTGVLSGTQSGEVRAGYLTATGWPLAGAIVTAVKGVAAKATAGNFGNVTNIYGVHASTSSTTFGTVSNSYNFYGAAPTNGIGILTNAYGLYLENITAGTTNYSIYSAGGTNYFAGNVGIGTTTPGSALEVTGQVKITGGVPGAGKVLTSDAAGLASWSAAPAGSVSGLSAASASQTLANANFSQTWNWDTVSTGSGLNLGSSSITSGTLFNTSSTSTAMTGTLGNFVLSGDNAANTGSVLKATVAGISSAAVPLMVTNSGTGMSFRVNDNGSDSDPTPFIVDNAGNVGIGTTAPSFSLDIQNPSVATTTSFRNSVYNNGPLFQFSDEGGSANTASISKSSNDATGPTLSIRKQRGTFASATDVINQDNLGSLIFSGYSGSTYFGTAKVASSVDGTFTSTQRPPARLEFYTNSANGSPTERLRIDATGNVGIGTTTPGSSLDVTGNINSSNWFTGNAIELRSAGNAATPALYFTGTGSSGIFSPAANSLAIANNNSETVRITATGNVGIGTTSPSFSLSLGDAVANDGAFMAQGYGTVGTSGQTLTVAGAGTRMFWYPKKGAFRTGAVSGTQWDNASIGNYSFAAGRNLTSSGNASFASGSGGTASGAYTSVMGFTSNAISSNAVAIGTSLTASGWNSIALGTKAQTGDGIAENGSGTYSMAIGLGAAAGAIPRVTGASSLGIFMGDQSGVDISTSQVMAILGGNVGIGTTAPGSALEVAGQVKITGGTPGAGKILTSDAAGLASWSSPAAGSVSALSAAAGTQTLANTNYAQTWNWDTLNTQNALSLGSTSITSGNLFNATSTATAMTGTLGNFALSGNNAANTGTVLKSTVTGTSSAAVPLMVTNGGTGLSLRVNDNGTDTDSTAFVVDAAGNVGIGTTAPAEKLHLNAATGPIGGKIQTGGAGDAFITLTQGVENWSIANRNSGNRLGFDYQGSDLMTVLPSGNVGIGITAPAYPLDVNATSLVASSWNDLARFSQLGTGHGFNLGYIVNSSGTDLQWTYLTTAGVGNNLSLGTQGNYQRLNIMDSTGNVGIGTTAPAEKLDINGSLLLEGTSSLKFNSDFNYINSPAGNDLEIGTNSAARVTINSSGNVGIGITTPGAKLHLNGTLTNTSSTSFLHVDDAVFQPGSAPSAGTEAYGNYTQITSAGAASLTNATMTAISAVASHNISGSIDSVVGVMGNAQNASTGTITNGVGLFADVSNVGGGTISTGIGLLVNSVAGTDKYGIYVLDATAKNVFAGSVGIGTTTPNTALEVAGGLTVAPCSNVSLTADNQTVTVGNCSAIGLDSNNATATNRTFCLTAGATGQLLYLLMGSNAAEFQDSNTTGCGGSPVQANLTGILTLGTDDTVTLIYSGTKWVEIGFSNN
jgi:hypothetical protein